mmetsp:Transcript_15770/g.43014  ORF Transcript_15770/g.43014 Transcript_15770/m.43014 type:complete len:205 (-) Transcript_15770:1137-1751(-)
MDLLVRAVLSLLGHPHLTWSRNHLAFDTGAGEPHTCPHCATPTENATTFPPVELPLQFLERRLAPRRSAGYDDARHCSVSATSSTSNKKYECSDPLVKQDDQHVLAVCPRPQSCAGPWRSSAKTSAWMAWPTERPVRGLCWVLGQRRNHCLGCLCLVLLLGRNLKTATRRQLQHRQVQAQQLLQLQQPLRFERLGCLQLLHPLL